MIQVHVQRAHDLMVMLVLHPRQPVAQLAHVVIVDQRQRAYHLLVRVGRFFLNQTVANQIPKGLRAVGVTPLGNGAVELL